MQPHLIDQAIDRALQQQASGHLPEAESLYRSVLAAEPRHPEANHNLGVVLLELNRTQEALTHLKTALEAEPRDGQLWVSYIDALIHAGQYEEARAYLESGRRRGLAGPPIDSLQRRIDVLAPQPFAQPFAAGWMSAPAAAAAVPQAASPEEKSRILALQEQGDHGEAESLTRALTARFPDDSWGWRTLSSLLRSQFRFDEALEAVRTAIHATPEDPQAHFELGRVFDRLGLAGEAEASIRRALQLDPALAEAHNELGLLLERTNRPQEAETSYRRALALRPDWPAVVSNLAVALTYQGRLDEAEATFHRAIALQPENSATYVDLSTALRFHGKLDEAVAALRKAIALQPDNGRAHANLAGILRDTNRLAEAEATLRGAIERYPLMTEARSSLLFSLNYNAEHSPDYRLQEARRYGEAVRRKAGKPYTSWTHAGDPPRLRVGILSGDIHSHPVGYFLESVLGHLDRSRIDLIGYPTGRLADALTQRVRPYFAGWHGLDGLSDEEAAARIHGDGIHILIELSGHTPSNRLPIMAWKPAPVQVSWLGYFATTGVQEIDYLLADEVSVPAEHRAHFTERIWYLPDTRLCFTPPQNDLTVQPLPALANGHITFGSFQGLAKLGDRSLSIWGRVLDAIPDARLRIQSGRLSSDPVRSQLFQRLARFGVAADRVSLHAPTSYLSYLQAYAEVDIVLDTTPFPGGTTTCEALWMGVPTLTLAGGTLIARQGASLMRAAGLPQWVADDEDAFVAKAKAFAAETGKLAALRSSLRSDLRDTPLFDAARFAANLESALWQMWQAHRHRG